MGFSGVFLFGMLLFSFKGEIGISDSSTSGGLFSYGIILSAGLFSSGNSFLINSFFSGTTNTSGTPFLFS